MSDAMTRLNIALAIFLTHGAPSAAQVVRCEFAEEGGAGGGVCIAQSGDASAANMSRRTLLASMWPVGELAATLAPEERGALPLEGVLSIPGFDLPFELAREELPSGGSRLVIRTDLAWVIVREWQTTADGTAIMVFDLLDYPPASPTDLAIIRSALDRLPSRSSWDREDDRDCQNDELGKSSLFCVLAASVESHMGRYYHRQPALEVVRQVIRDDWGQRLQGHPIMDLNNHDATALDDLRSVLETALERAEREATSERD